MTRLQRLVSIFSRKANQARAVSSIRQLGQPVITPANFSGFTKEGYQKNAVVYRCVSLIAQACSGIELELYQGKGKNKRELESHPLLDLLAKPNPIQGGAAFTEAVIAYLKLTGNSYINEVKPTPNKPPSELWCVRPDYMKIVVGKDGYPAAYIFEVGGQKIIWPVDPIKLKSDILHIKTFHPNNDWYGMSPLEAAILSLDQNNAGNKWNLAMLQNSATPSGVLQTKQTDSNQSGWLTDEQFGRLKQELDDNYAGYRNTGRPLLLEGGLTWQQTGLSQKDMDFIKGKEMSALDICNIYGVPGEMLGLGQKTYSNYQEARQSFYEDTILPTMDMYRDELNRQLCPLFGNDLTLEYDEGDIEALSPKRTAKMTGLVGVNYLTVNEKRESCGYAPIEGMDVLLVGSQIVTTELENEDENLQDENMDENGPEGTRPEEITKTPETDDEASYEKGIKFFNPVSRNEKKNSWKKQNAKRKRLEEPFRRDLESELLKLSEAISDAAKGITDSRLAEFAMLKASNESMVEIEKTISKHIKYTVEDFGSMIFDDAKTTFHIMETKAANRRFQDFVNAYVKNRTGRAITEIEGTTKKQIHRIVSRLVRDNIESGDTNVDLSNDLRDEFDSLSKGRARTIARTEVSMASNNASLNAVKSLQIPGIIKEWNSIQDDRTRDGSGPNPGTGANHLDMDGVQVGLDEKFLVPPDTSMEGPGDDSAGPDQVCNCRCVLTYSQRAGAQ
jgi:HK97 family phage portal protein